MNSQNCKLNFMILQTNLGIGSTNFVGIANQVYYIDNRWNLNSQPMSLHVVINLMIWCPYSQLHKINFMNCIALFHKERYITYKYSPNHSLQPTLPKCLLSSLIQPCTMSVVIACLSSLMSRSSA